MTDAIRFLLNGAPVEARDVAPTTTLLDWLRETRGLTGTKEGCNEGDCGACTVALREIGADGALVTRPVNACIQLLPMMHGREVVTVEGLAGPDGAQHPVQRAMAELHGSQCGFCTPGFVMTLWTAAREAAQTGAQTGAPVEGLEGGRGFDDLLAGNLCRCTGYGPIRAAAREAVPQGAAAWETPDDAAAARLRALGAARHLAYEHAGKRFHAPSDLDAFADLVAAHPDATILGGATDVGLWVTKHLFDPDMLIWTGRVAELREMRAEDGLLRIGAAVTYAEAWPRIAALYPDMGELIRRIGAEQVRAAGTIGGNVANGSPIGDTPPALIAAGARLALRHGRARREIALEDFFLDYGRQDRAPGEFVEALLLPIPEDGARLRCHKVSKRFDQDITAVCGCFDVVIEGREVVAARLAYGGMAGVPKRAAAAEAALLGQPWSEASVRAAMAAMAQDFTPLADQRASAGYRMQVARNLLLRHYHETATPGVATRLARKPAA